VSDVEWRFRRGWGEGELAERLAATDPDGRNFDGAAELVPANGWNHVRSQALVARDAGGAPRSGDAFDRARRFVERWEFSDPRIVVGHFDPRRPFAGRVMLLELRPLMLRFLCPVVVGGVREETRDGTTTFGFSLETLEGHVERGREWFFVLKDHATGEVRFRVEAAWRPGQFPGWWAWLGFQVLGRRYQRAWHRLAHVRLRTLLAAGVEPGEAPRRLVHAGVTVPTEPIQFYALRAAGARRVGVEGEAEKMGGKDRFLLAFGFGALAGARSLVGPAILSRLSARAPDRARSDLLSSALASPRTARVLAALAAGELIADKIPGMSDRIRLAPLAARAASGALAGHAVSIRGGRDGRAGAAVGAATALAATWATWRLRGLFAQRLPAILAAVLEDAVVAGLAAALARRLARPAATELRGPAAEAAHA
jgi:uncharacterized protein (UPF0548 family)/uncharacterized membrane protein